VSDALRGVSLRVNGGEVAAVVGPNGAGKSTLLALVLGFLRPSAGTVAVGGASPSAWVRRNGAAYMPERFAPPPQWRVDRMLRAFARLEGGAVTDAAIRASEVIERFGLVGHATREVGTLSRGLLQRLGLAQAALARRALVVLDEPTEGLDLHGRALFRETVASLRAAGSTVVLASQDLAELERVADRAFVLDAGRVREAIELHEPAADRTWVITLASPVAAVLEAFPGAERLESPGDSPSGTRYAVAAPNAADFSARLATLLAAGAIVSGITQPGASLEERLRHVLDGMTGPGSSPANE
jgi:ABC-2 type transport system ATP-binding protein